MLSPAEEQQGDLRTKNLIVHAVLQIKNKLSESPIIFQHNIEYGFIQNIIGGSLVAIIFSIAILIYALIDWDGTLKNTGINLLIIYSLPRNLSNYLLPNMGVTMLKYCMSSLRVFELKNKSLSAIVGSNTGIKNYNCFSFSSSIIFCNSFSVGKLIKYFKTNTCWGKPIVASPVLSYKRLSMACFKSFTPQLFWIA